MKKFLLSLSFIVISGCAAAMLAQGVIVNPTTATFPASPDHSTAAVTSYALEIYDGTTVVDTRDLGKPTPTAGNITVAVARGTLQQNKNYTARSVAKGPGGDTKSVDLSDPFVWVLAPSAPGKVIFK